MSDASENERATLHCDEEHRRECGICLSQMARDGTSHALACGHVFHSACLVEWLVKCPPFSCPYCRAPPPPPPRETESPLLDPGPSVTMNETEIQTMLYPLVIQSRRSGACPALRRKAKAYCKARRSMLYWQHALDFHYNHGHGYYSHLVATTGFMYRNLLDAKIAFAARAMQLMLRE